VKIQAQIGFPAYQTQSTLALYLTIYVWWNWYI